MPGLSLLSHVVSLLKRSRLNIEESGVKIGSGHVHSPFPQRPYHCPLALDLLGSSTSSRHDKANVIGIDTS